jgi:ADP-heptose:LPS heptosyltransferase
LSYLIKCDRILTPVLSPFARVVSFVVQKLRLMMGLKKNPRPLVLRPGGMGDLVLLTLALRELGQDFCRFDFVIEKRSEAWAKHLGLRYYCYDRVRDLRIIWQIGSRTTVVDTEQLHGLSRCFATIMSAENVFGFSSSKGNRIEHFQTPYDYDKEHELVSFKKLMSFSLNTPLDSAQLKNMTSFESPHFLNNEMEKSEANQKHVVLSLAGNAVASRTLTAHEWTEFALPHLSPEDTLYITHIKSDRLLAEALKEHISKNTKDVFLICGEFDLVCKAIATAQKMITIDGGAVHLASYFNVPSVVFFTSGRSEKWAPLVKGSAIVKRSDLSCQPCVKYGIQPPCNYLYVCKSQKFAKLTLVNTDLGE